MEQEGEEMGRGWHGQEAFRVCPEMGKSKVMGRAPRWVGRVHEQRRKDTQPTWQEGTGVWALTAGSSRRS